MVVRLALTIRNELGLCTKAKVFRDSLDSLIREAKNCPNNVEDNHDKINISKMSQLWSKS
jgi:hypothetical protein